MIARIPVMIPLVAGDVADTERSPGHSGLEADRQQREISEPKIS
jgi:hypothetical protein